jgi:hypothetical protein
LLGCAAYLADVSISPEQVGKMSPAQQALHAARPTWSVAATAIAVWLGAAGCVGLIVRKKWATWLLLASLAGVVAQDVWLFVLSGATSEAGSIAFVLQGLVLAVSVGLVVLSRRASSEAWLS